MKKFILGFAVSVSMMGCASKGVTVSGTTGTTGTVRTPAAIVNNDSIQVDLRDVAALLKGYFSVKNSDKTTSIRGYSAYILNAAPDKESGRIVIYLDDPNDSDKKVLAVDSDKFVYTGGPLAGDEPSLATNRRDSLLIQAGNDGSGRSPWHDTVTVALRNNQLVVAGYDFDSYDRLGEYKSVNCSVNFLTGKGIVTISPPVGKSGKSQVRKFNVSSAPLLLKDWDSTKIPSQCIPHDQ